MPPPFFHLPRAFGVSLRLLSFSLIASTGWTASNSWDGGSVTNGNWSNATNWVGDANVPASGDTATFNTAIANSWGTVGSPIVIDSINQQIGSIAFTTAAGNYVIGSTGGNSLQLTSGGSIRILDAATNNSISETIAAPMVIMGTNATYLFANLKNQITSSLILNGAISGGSAGNTVLTFEAAQSASPNQANGNISNGAATSVSLVHTRGTWTYSGQNSYTGSTTVVGGTANLTGEYSGGGNLVIESLATGTLTPTVNLTGSANFSGDVLISGVGNTARLNLGSATAAGGALTNATNLILSGTSVGFARLALESTAGNADRIADSTALSLGNSIIYFTGNGTTNTTETVGALTLSGGHTSIQYSSPTNRTTTLAAESLTRTNRSTLAITGTNLGAASGTASRFTLSTPPSGINLVGSGGTPTGGTTSTKNLAIIPWAIGDGFSLMTYDQTYGLRNLAAGEVQGTIAAAATPPVGETGDNVRLSASETGITSKTINSLFLSPSAVQSVTGAGPGAVLTISSGALAQSGGIATTISGFDSVIFGNGEAVITPSHGSGIITFNSGIEITANGGLTKSGAGLLILAGANSYSGATYVNQGTLQVGNGGTSGDLGTSSGVVLNGGAILNYNRTDSASVNNVTGPGTVSVNSGTLQLIQSESSLSIGRISGVSGATLEFGGNGITSVGSAGSTSLNYLTVAGMLYQFRSGTVNLMDSARGFTSNIEVNGGTLNLVNNNFSMSGVSGGTQTLNFSSGQINVGASFGVSGLNGNGGASQLGTANSTFVANQTGGTFSVTAANGRFDLGSIAAGNSTTYNLSGGVISHTIGTGGFNLGADGAGTSSTTLNFSGGTLIESGTIAGAQALASNTSNLITNGTTSATVASVTGLQVGQLVTGTNIAGGTYITAINTTTRVVTLSVAATGSGTNATTFTSNPKQAFVWTGGTLTTATYNATNLTSTAGEAVSASSNTLTNAGGTMAPGTLGTAGRTSVVGNYSVTSPAAALAVDLGGTTQGNAFQNAPGSYDFLNVSLNATLGGQLKVNLINGFTPVAGNNFTIVQSQRVVDSLTGTFTNTVSGNGATPNRILVDSTGLNSMSVTYTAGTAAVNGSVVLGNYVAGNTYTGASGSAWEAASAGSWSVFDAGSTSAPATVASGAMAQFADGAGTGTGANLVLLDTTRNLQGIQFSSAVAGHNYTIQNVGAGAIILDNTGNLAAATLADTSANGNTNTVNVPITLRSNLAVSVANVGTTLILDGVISGTGYSVAKTGAGTLTLTGANTYTGPTTVSGGKLVVNGSLAAPSLVTVATGGTLGGSGSLGSLLVESGGTHGPGNSPGVQTVTGNASYASGSTFAWELEDNVALTSIQTVPVKFDQVQVNGDLAITSGAIFTLTLNGAGSTVDFTNAFWAANQQWLVFNVAGTGTGNFTLGAITVDSLGQNAGGFGSFNLVNTDGDIYLNWNAAVIPEPNSLMLLGFGLISLALLRRRRLV